MLIEEGGVTDKMRCIYDNAIEDCQKHDMDGGSELRDDDPIGTPERRMLALAILHVLMANTKTIGEGLLIVQAVHESMVEQVKSEMQR